MAYLRSHGTPLAISPFGDVTLTGSQTQTNKTLTTPTVGSMTNYTFPAGHVVKYSYNGEEAASGDAGTISSNSHTTTGIEVAHTTALSSADSFLE